MHKLDDGSTQCDYCEFTVEGKLGPMKVGKHEKDEHGAAAKEDKGRKRSSSNDPEDVSEMGTRLSQVLTDHAPDIRASSRRALLLDFDQQLNNIRTREQLVEWLEHDYHDVLTPGQTRRISRAMFPGSGGTAGGGGGDLGSGLRAVNVPGLGPVIVLSPQDRAAMPQQGGAHFIQLGGGGSGSGATEIDKRLDKIEKALAAVLESKTGPPMRRRYVPRMGADGEMETNARGEPVVDLVEEPYDPQDTMLERLMTFQQRMAALAPRTQADGLRPEDIRQAAKEATEPLQKQLQEVQTQLTMGRVRTEAEESVRNREVIPLMKEVEKLRRDVDESRRNQGLDPKTVAQLERQDRVLKRVDVLAAQAAEYVNLQNLRQMGVEPEHLADIYRASRAKGQVSEDEWTAVAQKVRR